MVGSAIGAAQCFYWLHEDVLTTQAALSRKISSISAQLDERDSKAAMRLVAMKDAAPSSNSSTPGKSEEPGSAETLSAPVS